MKDPFIYPPRWFANFRRAWWMFKHHSVWPYKLMPRTLFWFVQEQRIANRMYPNIRKRRWWQLLRP